MVSVRVSRSLRGKADAIEPGHVRSGYAGVEESVCAFRSVCPSTAHHACYPSGEVTIFAGESSTAGIDCMRKLHYLRYIGCLGAGYFDQACVIPLRHRIGSVGHQFFERRRFFILFVPHGFGGEPGWPAGSWWCARSAGCHVLELQFCDSRLRSELRALRRASGFCRSYRKDGAGVLKRQQIVGCVIEASFEPVQVVHHHKQQILQFVPAADRHLDGWATGRCWRVLHLFSVAAGRPRAIYKLSLNQYLPMPEEYACNPRNTGVYSANLTKLARASNRRIDYCSYQSAGLSGFPMSAASPSIRYAFCILRTRKSTRAGQLALLAVRHGFRDCAGRRPGRIRRKANAPDATSFSRITGSRALPPSRSLGSLKHSPATALHSSDRCGGTAPRPADGGRGTHDHRRHRPHPRAPHR